jgi:alginate O-acetyltransferase complex protein AlgI
MVFVLHALLPRRGQNLLLIAAGLSFLSFWGLGSVTAFVAVTSICFLAAARVHATRKERIRLVYVSLTTALVIAILIWARGGLRGPGPFHWTGVYLAGLSFYALQNLSYVYDVYRRQLTPASLENYWAFSSFFPLLTMGPIERFGKLGVQFKKRREVTSRGLHAGFFLIALAVFKKLVLADRLAIETQVFRDQYPNLAAGEAWLLLALGLVQLYLDFSAYIDLARGIGRIFGIELSANFIRPYLSRDPGDFWNRWNITLNSWFRDYVYWPLLLRTRKIYATSAAVFLLIGCWHGLRWNMLAGWLFLGVVYVFWLLIQGRSGRNYVSPVKVFVQRALLLSAFTLCGIFFHLDSPVDLPGVFAMLFDFSSDKPWVTLGTSLTLRIAGVLFLCSGLVVWFEGWNFDREKLMKLKIAAFTMAALTIVFGVPESRYFLYMGY